MIRDNKGKWTIVMLLLVTLFATCKKKTDGVVTVTTKEVTEITGNSAKTGGTVKSSGYAVGECGVCYGESRNPTLDDNFTKDHEGEGKFDSSISNLKSGSTYYVRAYAKTSSGVEYGDEKSFTTQNGCTINVFADPTAGGTVTGAGVYQQGQNCIVTATANSGYTFTNWTEDGTVVSSNISYSFTVSGSRNLTANFSLKTYTINVSVASGDIGTVSGGGEYGQGKSCTVTATPNNPICSFLNWTENGEVVSSNTSYTFTVTRDRDLVAHFASFPTFTVTVSANPSEGGTVSGGGTGFGLYEDCTVKAVANPGYVFVNWTEYQSWTGQNVVLSTEAEYTIYLESDRNLVANFVSNAGLPLVSTDAVTNITSTMATAAGSVIANGGSSVIRRGFCWSTQPNPTIETASSMTSGSGTGSFTGQITNLTPNTYYYLRAFATNSSGTSYGNELTFITENTSVTDTWLYYDDGELYSSWGYLDGGPLEWAVMFPDYLLAQYEGMNVTKIRIYAGSAGSYYDEFYYGETLPETLVYSGYSELDHEGWWDLILYEPVSLHAQNLWISLYINHEAGEYPAGCSVGSGNPNARWINWGSHGWCDAYTSGWSDKDLTWIIRAFVTDGGKEYEIELPLQEAPSYRGEPKKIHTSQSVGSYRRSK